MAVTLISASRYEEAVVERLDIVCVAFAVVVSKVARDCWKVLCCWTRSVVCSSFIFSRLSIAECRLLALVSRRSLVMSNWER